MFLRDGTKQMELGSPRFLGASRGVHLTAATPPAVLIFSLIPSAGAVFLYSSTSLRVEKPRESACAFATCWLCALRARISS